MTLLWRRYAKAGGGPSWFPVVIAAGFAGLAVWAAIAGDWLTAGIAGVMVLVAGAGYALMRRVRAAVEAPEKDGEVGDD